MMKPLLLLLLPLALLTGCKPKVDDPKPSSGTETNTEITRDYKAGYLSASIVAKDGDIVACGMDGSGQPMVVKFSENNGGVIWRKTFDVNKVGTLTSIVQQKDETFAMCGTVIADSGDYNVMTTILDQAGDIMWQKESGNKADEIQPRIGFSFWLPFICAAREMPGGHDIAFSFVKQEYPGLNDTFPVPGHQVPYHVTSIEEGGIVIVGTSHNTLVAPGKLFIASYGGFGKRTATHDLDGGDVIPKHSAPLQGIDIIICGSSVTAGKSRGFIANTDKFGNMNWHKEYSSEQNMLLNYIAQDNDGFVAVGHIFGSEEHGTTECVLVKMDKDGNELWRKSLGSNTGINDEAVMVHQKANGEYMVLCNSTDKTNSGTPVYRYFMTSISAPDPK